MANEGITVGAMGALVRAALNSDGSEISVYPTGSARVEKITDASVQTPDGEQVLALYAVFGLGFTPDYLWFDDKMDVAVVGQRWLHRYGPRRLGC